MNSRLPIITVLGSGTLEYTEQAVELGHWLARIGVHLLTGGGGGIMTSVSRGFYETPDRKGKVIGILPCERDDSLCRPTRGYPNPWVEIPIITHLPLSGSEGTSFMSRNHINVLTADAAVALPGGSGTRSEIILAIQYQRPIIAYLKNEKDFPGIPSTVPQVKTLEEVQVFLKPYVKEHCQTS